MGKTFKDCNNEREHDFRNGARKKRDHRDKYDRRHREVSEKYQRCFEEFQSRFEV